MWSTVIGCVTVMIASDTHLLLCFEGNFMFLMCFLSSALMNKEQEAQAMSQSSGPSESELALQETVSSLQQERDSLSLQYQAQVTLAHDLCR